MLRFPNIKWDITYLSPVLLQPTVLPYGEGAIYNPLTCRQRKATLLLLETTLYMSLRSL